MKFLDAIVGGVTLIREAIQSRNYDPGVAGWAIFANGDAEFNSIIVRLTANLTTADVIPSVNGAGSVTWNTKQMYYSMFGDLFWFNINMRNASSVTAGTGTISITPPTGILFENQAPGAILSQNFILTHTGLLTPEAGDTANGSGSAVCASGSITQLRREANGATIQAQDIQASTVLTIQGWGLRDK